MENKNFNWRPMSEYTGGRVLATNGLDVLIGEINSEGDCESEEDRSTVLCGITGFIKIEEILPKSEDERIELLNYLYDVHDDDEERARWIAYLEKQGEQNPVDKIQLGKKYRCIASPRYSTFIVGGIYKPKDKFLCSLMNFCSDCFEPIEDE